MAETLICRILPTKWSNTARGSGECVVLELHPANGAARRLTIARPQDLKLEYGVKIKAIVGKAVAMINPGTQAGAFILDAQAPPADFPKTRVELEITDELTKYINRGKITFDENEIGGLRGGTLTTR